MNEKTPYQATLDEAGLAHNTAHRWQVMSWLPEPDLEAYFAKTREAQRIITSEEVFRLGKKAMPHDTVEPDAVEGSYSVLIIDPPWPMQRSNGMFAPIRPASIIRRWTRPSLRLSSETITRRLPLPIVFPGAP